MQLASHIAINETVGSVNEEEVMVEEIGHSVVGGGSLLYLFLRLIVVAIHTEIKHTNATKERIPITAYASGEVKNFAKMPPVNATTTIDIVSIRLMILSSFDAFLFLLLFFIMLSPFFCILLSLGVSPCNHKPAYESHLTLKSRVW